MHTLMVECPSGKDENENIMYYSFITFIAATAAIIMIFSVHGNAALPRREKRHFISIFAAIVVGATCEWAALELGGRAPLCQVAIPILKAVEFSLAPLLGVLYVGVIAERDSKAMRIAYAVVLAHAVFECACAPFGIVFYVDDQGIYHHGRLYFAYIAAFLASGLFLLVETSRFSKGFQYRNRHIPWLILVFLTISISVQMADSSIRVTWLALSVSGMMFYLFYCSIIQQTDALTRLLNRRSYEGAIEFLDERAVLMLFDVDCFKQLNDMCGHDMGDKGLQLIARTIYRVFSPYGCCYRIGGDEFCAIITRDIDRIEELSTRFDLELALERRRWEKLPEVSVGFALYNPKSDDKAIVFKNADDDMYRKKKERKARNGIPSR